MNVYTVIWKDQFVEKLAVKHGVETNEVEEVLFAKPMCVGLKKATSKEKTYTRLMDKHKREGT